MARPTPASPPLVEERAQARPREAEQRDGEHPDADANAVLDLRAVAQDADNGDGDELLRLLMLAVLGDGCTRTQPSQRASAGD